MLDIKCIVLCIVLGMCASDRDRPYVNYKLVTIIGNSEVHLNELLKYIEVDVISRDNFKHSVSAIVKPMDLENINSTVLADNGRMNIIENNLQRSVDIEYGYLARKRRKRGVNSLEQAIKRFLNLQEITQFNSRIMSRCRKLRVRRKIIGYSVERRPIEIIKISGYNNNKKTRTIFIEAGVHAREWLSPATANYIIYQLACRPENAFLGKMFNWEILQMANPDGYKYTFEGARYWRKNRQNNTGSSCIGTDLNRNFNVSFRSKGASDNPCSLQFRGNSPSSAPEVKALSNYILVNRKKYIGYLSLHTYGQYMLLPWAHKKGKTADYEKQMRISRKAARATGYKFTIGSCYSILYPASGSSLDFAKENAQIPNVFTWELMGSNFAIHRSRIPRFTKALFKGVKSLALSLLPETTATPMAKLASSYSGRYTLGTKKRLPAYIQLFFNMPGK